MSTGSGETAIPEACVMCAAVSKLMMVLDRPNHRDRKLSPPDGIMKADSSENMVKFMTFRCGLKNFLAI